MSEYQEYGYETADPCHTFFYIHGPLLSLLDKNTNKCILDMGCGNGYIANYLIDKGYNVYGTDASEDGITIANEKNPGRFFIQDFSTGELPPGLQGMTFDTIISTEVIEHLYDPYRFAHMCKNILSKTKGELIVSTPYHGYFKNLMLSIFNKWDRHISPLWQGGHIKFWSRNTVTQLLNQTGFKVTDFRGCGRFPYFWMSNDHQSKSGVTDSFSVIILTYNEEKNISACLDSLRSLDADIYIVDSGSTDKTLDMCRGYTSNIFHHPFDNYGAQRNWALNNLPLTSNWVLNMDADHRVTPELAEELTATFSKPISPEINGFLVSRRTMFMGKWIKHGGHYPTYHAILFRKGFGQCEDKLYDQHFKVTGKTQLMKGDMIDIITESLTTFIARHNHWATLEAQYHFDELNKDEANEGVVKARFLGNPIERRRYIKKRYESFPLFVRPVIYYLIRYFIRLGFLDGPEGLIFHFLQGFWFRFLIDAKIYELNKDHHVKRGNTVTRFIFTFLFLFLLLYYFNLFFFGLTNPGGHYSPFLAGHLNYIQGLRWLLLNASTGLLHLFGFQAICNNYELLVAGRGSIQVVYSCLGLGVSSFFAAFVLAYPKPLKARIIFIIAGILIIEILNVIRFVLLALFWNKTDSKIIDHHTIFNVIIYLLIAISLYFWVKSDDKENNLYAAN